jgi:hypothetical protein
MLKVVKQKQSEAKGQDGRSFEKEKWRNS